MDKEEFLTALRVRIASDFDMKQTNYANHIGVSRAFVSAVLNGKKEPSKAILDDMNCVAVKCVRYETSVK